ncbi:preprotein translocase subunit SecG [Candidatus Curtissbacteria bacterium RBG_13_35_7]|uniref:Protein-export membrane protein SecG n=1 Tax=Candidatus Curtissbacteria bacterium RBG_13_35_7 TaxID=1797705 RepID=A0A1F5G4Z4_9BACT|nr:MAG: preprotein translocase subunit SecG [Candidatus Curtissbacteria bacterium RBG_13_35_7]
MKEFLIIMQIIVSLSLIGIILIQSRGSGLGTAFGGSGAVYRSKRGIEKVFVYLTIFLGFLFFLISAIQIIV